jgi:hypothetical protein
MLNLKYLFFAQPSVLVYGHPCKSDRLRIGTILFDLMKEKGVENGSDQTMVG